MRSTFHSLMALTLAAGLVWTGCGGGGGKGAKVEQAGATEAAAMTPRQDLIRRVGQKFDDPRLAHAHFGVLIQEADSGEVWYERNPDRLFMPASNEKIPTTAAALMYLGPFFTFETQVCHSGKIENGVLTGDLIVFGNGDPTIYNRFHEDARDVFRGWAKQLKEKGVTRITGDIIGNDNAWDDEHTGNGWPWDELTPWYYAEYGALQFNENYIDIQIIPPATVDGKVELKPNVPSTYYKLINNIQVVADGRNSIDMYRPPFVNDITISGTVVAGSKPFEETPTITNPTKWYVWALKETLQEEGIVVQGNPVDCDDIDAKNQKPTDYPKLFVHQSPPLHEILKGLMARSQNMYAETMVHTMGWKADGIGTFAGGRKVVQEQLATLGVEPGTYSFSDGSGLSRYNYVSPRMITTIYSGMLDHKYKDYWWEAQSIPGQPGTLRARMKGTAAETKVRGKTGSINAVKSLSGYAETADGEQLVFSFLCNGFLRPASEVDALYDEVAVMLAEHSDTAKPAAGQ